MDKIDRKIYEPYVREVQRCIKNALRSSNKQEITILEAGAGHSSALSNVFRRVDKVIGIDLDKEALDKNEYLDEKLVADLTDIPLGDKSVDLITCAWVLEHIEKPSAFAREVGRVLRPGGYFVFIAPNRNSIYALITRIIPMSLHSFFTETLYKRQKGDTYKTFYRMNTEAKIDRFLFPNGMRKVKFLYNDDQKYLGFSIFTKLFAKIWHQVIMKRLFEKYRVHIIGVYRKESNK
ncbi:class I SAM-dependent methyltransferase [Candidatus Dojkabacteria bacterium]|uniref:Class I SAM-dependent methyltransferase n=1 Tax=Candidatus Dojkabacteria bacterium TaxID=2099670 RepID=A0A955I2E2_9BACT|nr:class I SAM-dependent methyltransferase [Candidatus Dojkabacteria bacterium]